MAEIVNGLFGIDPAALQANRQALDEVNAFKFANLTGGEQAQYGAALAGRQLGRVVPAMFGIEDPMLAKANLAKRLSTQFDITSESGLRQYAQALAQNGAPDLAQLAVQRADQLRTTGLAAQQTEMNIQKTQGDITKSQQTIEREDRLREALAALPPNATEAQYLAVFRQFGSPDQQARVIQASMDRNAKIAAAQAEAGNVGTAGAVGKTGAYRDINGVVFGPTEMKAIRQEFKGAEDLLDTLNKVSATDIKNAESFVDWTTKSSEVKGLAKTKTLSAQSKIAASQLLEQINSLPPGSASDADMRAAMKNFPGYSDPTSLQNWVNETKAKLQSRLGRISDQFAFKPTVTSTGNIDIKSKPAAGVSTSDMDLINKYSTPTR